MKKLGAYIKEKVSMHDIIIEQNTFVWYEVTRRMDEMCGNDVWDVSIWSLKNGYPHGRKPDAMYSTTNPHSIDNVVIPMKKVADDYCVEWENCNWQIKDCKILYDYRYGHEFVSTLKVDRFGSNNYSHWKWGGDQAMSVLKNAKVNRIYKLEEPHTVEVHPFSELVGQRKPFYGMGGFTTRPVLSPEELDRIEMFGKKIKETKTMEKKTMTETDTFLKHINGITITSTYSKLDFGDFGDPYYIYYPEMEITEDIADTLLTVLLMAKREYIHKVVFNPEKGTTTISKSTGDPVTVRCKDGEFDYILGYEMARSKMYLGHNDYNWFNKIKNHRKTHIEYTEKPTEPKAKRTSKKGGKKS